MIKTRHGLKKYRLGIPPLQPIPSEIYTDKREAQERAKDENRLGEYKGRGVKVYQCDEAGNII